ncbi:T9SS type A sorting domain-containing protein [Ekhidna sp.]|uniref:T9SS type A sorting domain-containing protein n=1 Tax=Ekhidna sp. TaxID=2608089 RepID=UPI003CCB94B2
MKKLIHKLIFFSFACVLCLSLKAQFTQQGYATNTAGGTLSGGSLSTEVGTSTFGGRPRSESFRFINGLPAYNLESAIVTVESRAGSNPITDEVEAILLRVRPSGKYDTLDIITNTGGDFSFNPVFVSNYLVNIDSDPEKYVATYYGDAFLWEEAEVLELSGDSTVQIQITAAPQERGPDTGEGIVRGTIEEDLEDDNGRIMARRRAAKRKCGLRKRRRGGRLGQDNDEFELIAYGETNDNGEFEYGFLPEGTYRFFVEYPGIPLDESSFVQFEIGEAGVSDDEFVLAAFVSEEGIVVELVLGITDEIFTNFNIYPNPTVGTITVKYDRIIRNSMNMQLVDAKGNVLMTKTIDKKEGSEEKVSLENYPDGMYFLKFTDEKTQKNTLTFRVIKQ